jgi:hypothetical protein
MVELGSDDFRVVYSFFIIGVWFILVFKCYVDKVPRDKKSLIILFSTLILFSTYALLFETSFNDPMDWSVAVGTILLALFAYLAIVESKKNAEQSNESMKESISETHALVEEIKNIRKIEYIRIQIDELYVPLNKYIDEVRAGRYGNKEEIEEIDKKGYLWKSMKSYHELSKFVADGRHYFASSRYLEDYSTKVYGSEEEMKIREEGKQKAIDLHKEAEEYFIKQAVELRGLVLNDMAGLQVELNHILKSD